jgi:hypothetical protein
MWRRGRARRVPAVKRPEASRGAIAAAGSAVVMKARLEPSGKKPPKRRRPEPRSSMKTNDAKPYDQSTRDTSVKLFMELMAFSAAADYGPACPRLLRVVDSWSWRQEYKKGCFYQHPFFVSIYNLI